MKKLSYRLAHNSLNAVLGALEIYNKPDCKYREESFCILMINGFELLFKAKILLDNNEKMKSLYIYENKKGKNNKTLKQKIIKRNRIGEPYTIDINKCMNELLNNNIITKNIKENVDILIEIRDNAIHLLNRTNNLKLKIYSICVASIKNYVKIYENWFGSNDINNYNFFITPLNFNTAINNFETLRSSIAEKNFMNYIELVTNSSSQQEEFDIIVNVDIKISKNIADEAVLINYAKEGKKINVEVNDEIFKKMYPFIYKDIVQRIQAKAPNVKFGKKFNEIKKEMQIKEICCKPRYYDLINKKGPSRYYYNSNFVDKFIELYNSNE